jgi:uncharacterized protein (DUF885 family)
MRPRDDGRLVERAAVRAPLAGALLALGALLAPALAAPQAGGRDAAERLAESYVESWISFYPGLALRRGIAHAIHRHEDRSVAAIGRWVETNRTLLAAVEERRAGELALDRRIDLRLLARQARRELDRWEVERPHERELATYADPIASALDPVLASPLLSAPERLELLAARLASVRRLAEAARAALRDGSPEATGRALEALERTAAELEAGLPEPLRRAAGEATRARLDEGYRSTAADLRSLVAHLRAHVMPRMTLPDSAVLGRDAFARQLALYTDSDLTPERLAELARAEIETARAALLELSRGYWRATYPDQPAPEPDRLIARAFRDLEEHRPAGNADYLVELRRYAAEVEAFVREHQIATVPEHSTLSIEIAPESAGPMARVGYVDPAPPFAPNPWTTWYLATIPDSFSREDRDDFWRSFNLHFKRFIVVHELFPGHYLQQTLLRENLHPVRVLFPYEPFTEGWATFAERVVLDHGWAEGDWLTRIAQVRKRLENANRAYTSVMAHCEGWKEDRVVAFSVETSLLAPQFAKSLWGRLMSSPMQILTYMLVGLELNALYDAELERLGDRLVVRDFMDAVLRAGPIPTEELAALWRSAHPD